MFSGTVAQVRSLAVPYGMKLQRFSVRLKPGSTRFDSARPEHIRPSPSGKASVYETGQRRFDSSRACHGSTCAKARRRCFASTVRSVRFRLDPRSFRGGETVAAPDCYSGVQERVGSSPTLGASVKRPVGMDGGL